MPLHVCPQCEIAMEATPYEDVVIDVCPSCRSVWLDRGELQKIISHVRRQENEALLGIDTAPRPAMAAASPSVSARSNDSDQRYDGKRTKRKKRGFNIWDAVESLID